MTDSGEQYRFMHFTGRTDQYRGREYKCNICDQRVWTCFGNVRQHARMHQRDDETL